MIDRSKYERQVLRSLSEIAKDEADLEELLYQFDERLGMILDGLPEGKTVFVNIDTVPWVMALEQVIRRRKIDEP